MDGQQHLNPDYIDLPAAVHSPQVPRKDSVPLQYDPNGPQPPPYNAERTREPYSVPQPMSNAAPPVTPLEALGNYDAWIDCPFCHQRTRTKVDKAATAMT